MDKKLKTKKKYVKPEIKSEEIMGFGAKCNGSSSGGRKTVAGAPDFCSGTKLLS